MSTEMNRRDWLRKSAWLTGGAALIPSIWQSLQAAPAASAEAVTGKAFWPANLMGVKAKLDSNENPFGPSNKVKQVLLDSVNTSYRYAFQELSQMKKLIADYEGISEECILLGAGSSPLLQAAAVHFSKNGGSIVTCDPTFDALPRDAEALQAKWVKVPLTSDYSFDLDGIQKHMDGNTSLVYIVNPNNPTGTVLDNDKLKAFCSAVSKRVPVFIDEAYIDYLPNPQEQSLISQVKKGENVIVARTFSKVYGLAGMRMGYLIAQPDMVKTLAKYNTEIIATPTIKAAMAAYQDQEFIKSVLDKTAASKAHLYSVLQSKGYQYIPSVANFVMFPIKMEGRQFVGDMLKGGASVRFWKFNSQEWSRVSIGTMEEMEAFATAFKEVG